MGYMRVIVTLFVLKNKIKIKILYKIIYVRIRKIYVKIY